MRRQAYYPLFFDLADRLCVVVGGGRVAERKARGLLACGARLKLISPAVTKGIAALCTAGRIDHLKRRYRTGDLEGASLVFAATGEEEVQKRVRKECLRLAVPLNAADRPALCDFIVPSVVRKGPILVAVSTSGLLPMLAKRLRKEIEEALSDDYSAYVRKVGAFRRYLVAHVEESRARRRIIKRVGEADVREVARMTLREMKARFLKPGEA